MTWAPKEYQKRVYEILSASPALTAIVGTRIYDRVPDDAQFPYVVIGVAEFNGRDSHTHSGWTASITLAAWTQNLGRNQAFQILEIIETLLHNQTLGANGWHELSFRRDFSRVLAQDDNVTYEGVLRFNLLTGEG